MLCKYCDQDKPLEDFELANVIKGVAYRRKKCRRCKQDQQNGRRHTIGDWLREYKKSLACDQCGLQDHRVLEFHHLSDKYFDIGNLLSKGCSQQRIELEIAKCLPLCANCHRILHYEEN